MIALRALALSLVLTLLSTSLGGAAILRVPSAYPSIQNAVYASAVGDTVLVAPGTYLERVVVPRRIMMLSEAGAESTTIDAQGAGIVVRTEVLVTGFVIEGFRITGGEGGWWFAGGIHIGGDVGVGGFATIRNNIIEHNHSDGFPGGMLAVRNCTVEDNIIQYNNRPWSGEGATAALEANGTIRRNIIRYNGVGGDLAIVKIHESDLDPSIVTDNVIVDNGFPVIGTFLMSGGGVAERNTVVFSEQHYAPVVFVGYHLDEVLLFANNIVVHSGGDGIRCSQNGSGTATFRCNDVWGSGPSYGGDCVDQTGNNGNISVDPLFCNALEGDYRLQLDSPCTAVNSPEGCGQIGARGVCQGLSVDGGAAPDLSIGILVEPNPASDAVRFRLPKLEGPAILGVYDLQGRQIYTTRLQSGELTWDPGRAVPRGVYFARVLGAAGTCDIVKFVLIE